MRITYNDVVQYQACPLLYTIFRKEPDSLSTLDKSLRAGFYRVFLREMELGHTPSVGAVTNGLPKYFKILKNEGKPLTYVNDVFMKVKTGYDEYLVRLAGQYKAVAVNLEAYYNAGGNYYICNIPVVLVKDNRIIPLFDDRDVPNLYTNYMRFACVALGSTLGVEVTEIMRVHFGQTEKGAITLTKHSLTRNIHDCELQLKNIIIQMASRVQTPNTSRCTECEFRRQCKT